MIENIPWSTASYWEVPTDARGAGAGGKEASERRALAHSLCRRGPCH